MQCGFVALVGPTNSGKSTLLNALVGQKLSIVSPLPQTTYHGVRGILNELSFQMVFTDTPGFQSHPDRVPRLLNQVADKNAKEADLLIWVFDASQANPLSQVTRLEKKIASFRPASHSICVLNKIDKIPKPALLPLMQAIHDLNLFSAVIPISARKGDGIEQLVNFVKPLIPEGVALYPTDKKTDRPINFLISELIREKVYRLTYQELPYSIWIDIEETPGEEKEGKRVPDLRAVMHVDSESRKAILIGKQGAMLKEIGIAARKDIEELLGHQICLKLHVKVQEQWKEDANLLNRYLELQ